MMFKTHLAAGFLASLYFIDFFKPGNVILAFLIVLFASILPDIDHPNSKLGKKFKIISWLFEHRGFFHGIFPAIFLAYFCHLVFGTIYMIAFLFGYLIHLAADALTKQGIMLFHPISKKRIKGFIRTNTFGEYVVFVIILIISIIKLLRITVIF